MAEITPEGYLLKTQNEYFEEETAFYIAIDPLWNLDPSTPDGLKIAHDSEVFGNLDEDLKAAYNSKDPNKARDVDLDIISSLTGTERNLGTPSTVSLTLGGVASSPIVAGSTVESTADGSQWTTNDDVVIGGGGTVVVNATNTVNGAVQANPNTITRIIDTAPGWQTVDNIGPAISGTNKDTNGELRIERANAVGRPGNNQIDSMRGEILAVDGVSKAIVLENDTDVTDGDGLPPHSIAPIVDGGTDADVALAIYLKKNPGATLYQAGTPVSELVQSPVYPDQSKIIKFSRPIDLAIVMIVNITDDSTLPIDTDELVTQAILDYVEGELIDPDTGFNANGFKIGEDVPHSRMFTPVNQVIGQYGNSFVSSMTLNGSPANVPVAFNELSRFTEANITVNVT